MNQKCKPLLAPLLLILTVGALAVTSGAASAGPPPSCTLDVPTITCVGSTPSSITIRICAGPSGAPAGVSIHWKKLSDWQLDGWAKTTTYSCISLGGNCGGSLWSLGPNQCRDITINASTVINEGALTCGVSSDCALYDLQCDTDYIFRVFAHNDPGPGGCNQSGFSCTTNQNDCTICHTAPCTGGGECTLTWGYWKTHGPTGCNPSGGNNVWPAGNQTVGCLSLSQADLCSILQDNPRACGKGTGSNAVLILEHQLIAAELNLANGGIDCAFVHSAISQANSLLCGNEYACIGAPSALGQQMLQVKDVLEAYNSDQCSCPNVLNMIRPNADPMNSEGKHSTWGQLKIHYR